MRLGCYDCVRKHLGEAAIFETEVGMGYPNFDVYVIGALSHASQEAEQLNPELAGCIRSWRLLWDGNHNTMIPYEELSAYIKACSQTSSSSDPLPIMPDELFLPQPKLAFPLA